MMMSNNKKKQDMSKLKGMKMPEKKPMDMAELEAGEEEQPEDMELALEGEETMQEDGMEQPSNPELEALSDDELLAEIKKRGLMSKLGEEGPEEEMPENLV